MATRRIHVIVEGRVQGVYFRAHTQEEARRLGLAGWVRNRPDGSVEALVEGESTAVDRMQEWFHRGSPGSRVSSVRCSDEQPAGDCRGFEIHFS